MVWHIFKKDLRLLWWNALMVTAVQLGHAVMQWRADRAGQQYESWAILLQVLAWLGGAFLTISIVHQDSLVGVRQDWLVRPIRRVDLLAAKLVFMLLLVAAPYGLFEFVFVLSHGLPWVESLVASVWASAFLVVIWYLPAMAFGVLTKSLPQAVGAAAMAFVLAVAIGNLTSQRFLTAVGSVMSWVPTSIGAMWGSCGLAALLALQYGRRATMKARLLAVGVALSWFFILLLPFSTAMALQEKISPLGKGPQMSFHPEDVPIQAAQESIRATTEDARVVWVPVRVEQLPGDQWLKADQTFVRLMGRDGATRDLVGRYAESKDKKSERTYLAVDVPDAFLGPGVTARLEAEVMGTVMHPVATATLPLTKEWVPLGRFGTCWAAEVGFGLNGTAMCLQPGAGPAVCVEYTLAGSTTMQCHMSYAPWGNRLDVTAVERFPGFISQPANTNGEHSPLTAIDWTSPVWVRAYGVERHVRVKMVIPEIVLNDWMAK